MHQKYNTDDIQALSATEAIRKRPELYFDTCFQAGNLNVLPLEMACHAIDEFFEENCNNLTIKLYKDYFTLRYNAGMDLTIKEGQEKTKAELIFTTLFACSNMKKHLTVGEKFCKLGICTINAASEWCHVSSVHKGKRGIFRFGKGVISTRFFESTEDEDYTYISLKPDPAIFGKLRLSLVGVREKTMKLMNELSGFTAVVEKG